MTIDCPGYLPVNELADLPKAIRQSITNDLDMSLFETVPGKPPLALVSKAWIVLLLKGEIEGLEAEVAGFDAETDELRYEAQQLTGADRARVSRRASRAAADAYDNRRALDATRAALRRLDDSGQAPGLFDAAE
jgi:hypothetical protein